MTAPACRAMPFPIRTTASTRSRLACAFRWVGACPCACSTPGRAVVSKTGTTPAWTRPALSSIACIPTAGRAAILKVLDTYRSLEYGLSRIEVQKLAYFLQEAGESLSLSFVKNQYGPYSDQLRHALNRMEGHFIRGLGDGVVEAEIEPLEDALAEAEQYVTASGHAALARHVERVANLIEGFQTPYGMELLATVHWVATHEPNAHSLDQAVSAVHAWNERKAKIMQPAHVRAAWSRLDAQGWL